MSRTLPRQKNVQQQNLDAEHQILLNATYWRTKGIPAALKEVGMKHGVDWPRSIVIKLDVDFPGMPNLFGLLLTSQARFIRFEIDADVKHQFVKSVEAWTDVTEEQNFNLNNPGTGIGFGALAIQVLNAMRSD